ncbi:MAG TPA: PAS domain S-box protein, partial [Thermoanaerobaculia bacterium]|nr:PAS domain S-box protein [Thermoanaerobaculia bacterium]
GRLVRVNREWERTLGWSFEEARRVDILREVYPDPEERRDVLEFMRRADRQWRDFTPRTRDGRVIVTSWIRIQLSDGTKVGFGVDVSERKRRENALLESETRFRQLAENINEVFWLADPHLGKVFYVSPAYERVFGRTCESLYREPSSFLEAVHPEDRERVRRAVLGKVASGSMDETYRVERPDGTVRHIRDRGRLVRDASGEPYRFAGIAEDITEQVRAEEERAGLLERETRARSEAEAALERLDAIHRISDVALGELNLDDLLGELLRRLRQTLRADAANIMLLDEDSRTLSVRAFEGHAHERAAAIRVPLGSGVSGRIAAEGRPMIVDDYAQVDIDGVEGAPASEIRALCRSVMGAPLRIADKVVGVLAVSSLSPRRFTDEELRLLLLVADRVAPAIERGRLLEVVGAERARLAALSHRFLTAQEEERRRVAVELHDELGQILTAVKLNLDALERSLEGAAPRHLVTARDSIDAALEKVRDMALGLRPSVLDDLGLVAALRWYLDRLARGAGLDARLVADAIPDLTPELRIACFRVAQAALTNVLRHARARRVRLSLRIVGDGLDLVVTDDGTGFDVAAAQRRAVAGSSIGLLGMAERVAWLGGTFEIRSKPEHGTSVRARFPLGRSAEQAER